MPEIELEFRIYWTHHNEWFATADCVETLGGGAGLGPDPISALLEAIASYTPWERIAS